MNQGHELKDVLMSQPVPLYVSNVPFHQRTDRVESPLI